jgi:MinD superfamily P-loop ATPase
MKIAVLSGKGGTGKTTLSMNMAYLLPSATLVDADVEEPNLRLFLQPKEKALLSVYKKYPVIDEATCNLCGACGDFCRFNTLLPARRGVLIHKELCHDCGGCQVVCKQGAITYGNREIGKIQVSHIFEKQELITGILNVGEVSGVKIISSLKEKIAAHPLTIIDSPPGTSCATVEAVEGVDYAIIVTEPTPFGLSDMKMVVEMLTRMGIPFGVVINKAGIGDDSVSLYCEINRISILGRIPFDKKYAAVYSNGDLIAESEATYANYIHQIIDHLPLNNLAIGGDQDA